MCIGAGNVFPAHTFIRIKYLFKVLIHLPTVFPSYNSYCQHNQVVSIRFCKHAYDLHVYLKDPSDLFYVTELSYINTIWFYTSDHVFSNPRKKPNPSHAGVDRRCFFFSSVLLHHSSPKDLEPQSWLWASLEKRRK